MTAVTTSLSQILADGGATFWLPRNASNLAGNVDIAFNLLLYICTFFFMVIVGAMTFFIIKYRRKTANDETPLITHNTPLEILWTGIPLVLVVVFFFIGFNGYMDYDTPASNAYVIGVEGRQWNFAFNYPNGGTSSELYVPINTPVKLSMESKDVLHAFYVPVFRVQRNLIPGRTTELWFIATKHSPLPNPKTNDPGGFPVFCTQYCGDGHSKMTTRIHVLDMPEFEAKLRELANPFKEKDPAGKEHWVPYAKVGQKFATSNGCFSCHSTDGSKGTGPTWKDLYKSEVEFDACNVPGYTLKKTDSDEKWDAYLRESIIDPPAKVVHGFTPQMQSFASVFAGDPGSQKDEKLRALITYIKSVGSDYKAPEENPELYDASKTKVHPESVAGQEEAKKLHPPESGETGTTQPAPETGK